ncbi:membrane protein [Salix suchowensis]|nr:membrane protein [Salix suchowensis]
MGRFAVRLGSFFRWFKSAEGIFALRTAVVTLALWIPAVAPSSAGFNYQHKGLWALIMAQDINYRNLVGMAVWYIGAGSGSGNPYGVVVATFIVMLFPRPTSARTLVRRTVAASLEHLGRVFASEVDAILAEEAKGRKGIVEKPNMDEHLDGGEVSLKEKRIRKLAEKLLAVALADVFSTISVLSHALSAGHPVPASLLRLRDRLIYHDRHMFAHEQPAHLSLKEDNEKAELGHASTKELDPSPNKVDGVTIGFEELTLDVLMVRG